MKYGKQLLVGVYQPWQDKYVRYQRLKRLIARFETENKKEAQRSRPVTPVHGMPPPALLTPVRANPQRIIVNRPLPRSPDGAGLGVGDNGNGGGENAALLVHVQSSSSLANGGYGDPLADRKGPFFEIVEEDLRTIQAFFLGKEAELEGLVHDLEKASHHPYLMEWKGDKQHFRKIYTEVCELMRYQEMNKEGLRKIVKKFDKTTGSCELPGFLDQLSHEYFVTSTKPLHLKERLERLLSRDTLMQLLREMEEDDTEAIFSHVKPLRLAASVGLLVAILSSNVLMHVNLFAHRCLALLAFTIAMWAMEVVPYFATALLVPVLVVLGGMLEDPKRPGHPLPADESADICLSSLVNHTTILVLGGYAVSAAFSRCEIELQIAHSMQKVLGHSPKLFMLAMMYLGLFLSAVISNHTAPVLCLSIITPIIRDFPPDSSFTKCLLLGLAFACNFGGMMTPIASMQDALAVGYLNGVHVGVSFGRWIAVAFPLCVLLTAICWVFLLAVYQPEDVRTIPSIVRSKENLNRRDWVVLGLSLTTIILWSTLEFTKPFLGDLGIVSLLFIVTMFGTGMLTQVNFNSFSWHTLFLLGGGNVLGKAVASSHLLDYLADVIFAALPTDNFPLLLAEILTFVLLISTFISHTVAALIVMPLVVQLGVHLGDAKGVAIPAAFAVSAAMALPFSSFPNVLLVSTTDDLDQPYLKTKDFFVTGLPISIIALIGVGTVGYALVEMIM